MSGEKEDYVRPLRCLKAEMRDVADWIERTKPQGLLYDSARPCLREALAEMERLEAALKPPAGPATDHVRGLLHHFARMTFLGGEDLTSDQWARLEETAGALLDALSPRIGREEEAFRAGFKAGFSHDFIGSAPDEEQALADYLSALSSPGRGEGSSRPRGDTCAAEGGPLPLPASDAELP